VPIARGQVVEIGGGFRIPDIMRQSGVDLIDVGTTNRTYISDYAAAITPATAALMRVHASNFRVTGFTESPSLSALAELAHEHGLWLLDDIGSGCLLDTAAFGLGHEPTPRESISAGADLAFFSGDKLLGGPQAGIIAGKREAVELLKRHPLARAARIDKASLAALVATLQHYVRGEAVDKIPVWRMIATPLASIEERAYRWAALLGAAARVEPGRSVIGGGSLPEETLPSWLVAVPSSSAITLDEMAARLRSGRTAVVGRLHEATLLLDPRTVDPNSDDIVIECVRQALA
jgi:L-seryl-tRNA(Ser) seleniumtransferase